MGLAKDPCHAGVPIDIGHPPDPKSSEANAEQRVRRDRLVDVIPNMGAVRQSDVPPKLCDERAEESCESIWGDSIAADAAEAAISAFVSAVRKEVDVIIDSTTDAALFPDALGSDFEGLSVACRACTDDIGARALPCFGLRDAS